MPSLVALGLSALAFSASATCPLGHGHSNGEMRSLASDATTNFVEKLQALNWNDVRADLATAITTQHPSWPMDYHGIDPDATYGGLMVRLAWHCAGSYRTYDGRGGCDGGRLRHDPELSWGDNVNLDKALEIIRPIKHKYGDGLSWGDLIILAGNVAQEQMGLAERLPFCAGRVDDADGTASLALGPSQIQSDFFPCEPFDGQCGSPLGPTTLTDIYVNPAGQAQLNPDNTTTIVHDTKLSAEDIRSSFGRMGMLDRNTLVLTAGGHTFGKSHGACPDGAGPPPNESPLNPWPGKCWGASGERTWQNIASSGFHGAWTRHPNRWDGEYWEYLLDFNWTASESPAGNFQYHLADEGQRAQRTDPAGGPLMFHNTDLAFRDDPVWRGMAEQYHRKDCAPDEKECGLAGFTDHYIKAWYELTTRDMGPVERCLGPDVSAVQPWQFPLPAPPANPPNPETVADRIRGILRQAVGDQNYDTVGQSPSNIATLGELAFRCARTFRRTDYTGGCNGGRIRFLPQNNWTANNGISFTGTTANDRGIELLDAIKAEFPSISWSDLIVLAGEVAMEAAGAPISIADNFCPGRSDVDPSVAENSKNKAYSEFLVPFVRDTDPVFTFTYSADLAGLTNREMAVLMARPRGEKMQQALGFSGSWTRETASVSNRYFQVLLNNRWSESETRSGEYIAADGSTIYMTSLDMAFLMSDELRSLADEYAGNNDRFLQDFAKAYLKVMTNDRFDGPTGNVCASRQPGADEPTTPTIDPVSFSDAAVVAGSIFGGLVVGAAGGMWYKSMFGAKPAQQDDYQSLNA